MGNGHLERLRSGNYRVVVYAGKDPITGRKVYLKETHPTEQAAVEARQRLLERIEAGNHPDRAATVDVLMDRWMEVVDHGLTTRHTTAGYVRRTIKPALGEWPLRKLQHRVDVLDRLYKHLGRCNQLCDGRPFVEHRKATAHDCEFEKCQPHTCRGMAPASVHRVHAIISGAFAYAISWGWVEKNPAEYAHPPKLKRRRARPPRAEQVARLLNLAWLTDVELAMFLWLATTTGARRGELTSLRWTHVELSAGLIVIETNYVMVGGQREFKGTKTDADRRLSLDRLTIQMLTDFHTQRVAALAPAGLQLADDAFVFTPDPAGLRPWHPDHFTHGYRELATLLDITEPLKNLRHFNATQLLAAGVDLRTTAGRLGHTDGGATTLKVYADWMPATDRRAAEQLSQDLAVLRDHHAANAGPRAGPEVVLQLARAARPLRDILEPPIDGRTMYVDVVAAIRAAIDAGRLVPVDLVPTVTQLSAWYGIARSTAQRAVTALVNDGSVTRARGRWTVSPTSGSTRATTEGSSR